MRIAIISDIHGNYPALVKVIEDTVLNNVDKYIFLGDYIFDLPYSNDVVRFLMEIKNAYIIKGNKEIYLKKLASDNQDNWIYNQMGVVYQAFKELTPDLYNFLDGLEDELYIEIFPGVTIYTVHVPMFFISPQTKKAHSSSYRYHKKMLEKPFTHKQYLAEFNGIINTDECSGHIKQMNANIILFGHNHLQCHAYCGDKLIINPGSCGQPLDFNNNAAYTILDITNNGFNVLEKRVAYDVESVIKYAKHSIQYENGKTWSELVFLALKSGRDYFGFYFEIANMIASLKNEEGSFYSNSTWEEARIIFNGRYKEANV